MACMSADIRAQPQGDVPAIVPHICTCAALRPLNTLHLNTTLSTPSALPGRLRQLHRAGPREPLRGARVPRQHHRYGHPLRQRHLQAGEAGWTAGVQFDIRGVLHGLAPQQLATTAARAASHTVSAPAHAHGLLRASAPITRPCTRPSSRSHGLFTPCLLLSQTVSISISRPLLPACPLGAQVSGAWIKKGSSKDELAFSGLKWTRDVITAQQPQICLTLDYDSTLDEICLGKQGTCAVALYSLGDKGARCCPTVRVPVGTPQ
jgi:hypothetical protein